MLPLCKWPGHGIMYNVYLSLYTLYTLQSMPPGVLPGWQQSVHSSLLLWPTAVIYEEDTNERWQFGDNMVIYIYRKYEIYINISWITRPFHRSKIVPIADFITRPRLTGRPDWLRVANTSSHSWNYVKTCNGVGEYQVATMVPFVQAKRTLPEGCSRNYQTRWV